MKYQTKTNLDNQKLKLIQDSSKIICYHCGGENYSELGIVEEKKRYFCQVCQHQFTEGLPSKYAKSRGLPLGDDVWHASDLGLNPNDYKNDCRIFFVHIHQDWLKETAKKFIRYGATFRKFSTLKAYVSTFNSFSEFLQENYPNLTGEALDRNVIIDYYDFLNKQGLGTAVKRIRISNLRQFFETINLNSWHKIPHYLIRLEDFPRQKKIKPRYIPEEVLAQLNQHLELLPKPVMRMVLVLQETGLRISELVQLSLNCIKQDRNGDWFLQYLQGKFSKEHTIPISREIAKVIQEQQEYIKQNLLCYQPYSYLFCANQQGVNRQNFMAVPYFMSPHTFIRYLKLLAQEKNICAQSGEQWNFQSHQFRHTVGTQMINNGVPQHIIQRYLGHESPEMTMNYAHIHDQTLKKEIAKFHERKVVNVVGEIVDSTTPELDNNLDLHLLKKKVLAQALPNGSCARPIVLGECPHANACLTCGDFRTTLEFLDQHKAQLEETEKLVKNAEENGWKRHAEMNTKVRDNLQKIITTLESGNQELVSGGEG